MASLKVAIIGSGNVGSALGSQLAKTGAAAVKYGSRDPASAKLKQLLAAQPKASADTVDNAIQWSDAVIVATPGANDEDGIKKIAASLGPHVKGKVVLDATNPLTPYPGLEVRWAAPSAGEILAEALPGTHVFKAFNTIADDQMHAPDGSQITGQQLTMMYAGGPGGKDIAEQVIAGVGFKPVYVGPIRYARNLEAIAELYIHLRGIPGVGSAEAWGSGYHFQVIRKP